MEDYQESHDMDTVFFSTYMPDMIEQKLLKTLANENVKTV